MAFIKLLNFQKLIWFFLSVIDLKYSMTSSCLILRNSAILLKPVSQITFSLLSGSISAQRWKILWVSFCEYSSFFCFDSSVMQLQNCSSVIYFSPSVYYFISMINKFLQRLRVQPVGSFGQQIELTIQQSRSRGIFQSQWQWKARVRKISFGVSFFLSAMLRWSFWIKLSFNLYKQIKMQNKKKQTKVKKIKKNKKSSGPQKFSKNEPAPRSAPETEQKKRIVTNNVKITRTINKNIEKTMMDRAVTGKEKFKFLKI